MRLIDSIEISYFRSLYKVSLRNCRDLNVLVGKNDCGKSNVLRALNLFFNNRTSPREGLKFLQDVTHFRQREAYEAKGRLTIWMRITFNNVERWSTLPGKFSVKRVWNRYGDQPETTFDNGLSQATVTRFLNKTNYIYVPAVRERQTYADYLRVLYDTLAGGHDTRFSAAANSLSTLVNDSVAAMAERIEAAIGVHSTIDIPTDFQDLFERLSFSTLQDEFKVPLQNRGDGIQARHIPHILEFVCSHNWKINVWGYEEPENSLEMQRSFELADEFERDFAGSSQLFVTSHSPAFYSRTSQRVARYYVLRTPVERVGGVHVISEVRPYDSDKLTDKDLGIAHLIAQRSASLFQELEKTERILSELRSQAKPVVLTEGKTDAAILQIAWTKLRGGTEMPFTASSCDIAPELPGGAAGASMLKRVLEHIPAVERTIRIGIFDRDAEGKKAFDSLKNFLRGSGDGVKVRSSGSVAAVLLPSKEWDDPFFDLTNGDLSIEQMFPRDTFSADDIDYEFQVATGCITETQARSLIDSQPALAKKALRVRILFRDKEAFSRRAAGLPQEKFRKFEDLFSTIEHLIEYRREKPKGRRIAAGKFEVKLA